MNSIETYKAVFDSNPDAIVIVDEVGAIVLVNHQATMIFGHTRDEMLGQKIEMLIPGQLRAKHVHQRQDYSRKPVPRTMGSGLDIYALRKDGTEFPVEISLSPILLKNKTLIASAIRDVSERKEREQMILANELKYQHTLDHMLEGVRILDNDLRYLYVNEACIAQSRTTRENLIGRTLMEVFPGFENSTLYPVFMTCLDTGESRFTETEFVFPDGHKGWFELSIQRVPEGLFILSIDITDRKQAEEKMKEQKAFTEAILNNIPADIAVFNKDHQYVFLNPKALKSEEMRTWLIGKDDFDYCALKGIDEGPARKRRELFNKAVKEGRDVEWVDEYPSDDGKTYILRRFHPFKEDGELKYVIGYGIDITRTKEAEARLKELYAEVQAANWELEEFAYMVSHDLQEPLRMVTGFMNLLKMETEGLLNESTSQYIHFASDGAVRMKNMIEDLLQYSRVGTTKEDLEDVDLDEVVSSVTHLLNHRIREFSAKVEVNELCTLKGIKPLLTQLFMNLLSNALKYHGEKPPEISIGCIEEKDHWLFYVKDNGIGIDEKFFDKIFVIFHRLHSRDSYTGTGVGLAISKKIVEKHGGRIWVESAPGKGSTFYFTISKNTQ